jgi:hypothetical protein
MYYKRTSLVVKGRPAGFSLRVDRVPGPLANCPQKRVFISRPGILCYNYSVIYYPEPLCLPICLLLWPVIDEASLVPLAYVLY